MNRKVICSKIGEIETTKDKRKNFRGKAIWQNCFVEKNEE